LDFAYQKEEANIEELENQVLKKPTSDQVGFISTGLFKFELEQYIILL
jgi:hypothetical protein